MPISYRAAQTLIKRGDLPALTTALDQHLDPNSKNENGWTLLMLAAVEGSVPLGRLLIERGADLAAFNLKGASALSIATNRGFTEFADLLKENGAPTS
jgi:ankyrin repeat protein